MTRLLLLFPVARFATASWCQRLQTARKHQLGTKLFDQGRVLLQVGSGLFTPLTQVYVTVAEPSTERMISFWAAARSSTSPS